LRNCIELFSENVLLCVYSIVSYQEDPFNPVDTSGLLANPFHPSHYIWQDVMANAAANRAAMHHSIG
jgi:hypothetical protein